MHQSRILLHQAKPPPFMISFLDSSLVETYALRRCGETSFQITSLYRIGSHKLVTLHIQHH